MAKKMYRVTYTTYSDYIGDEHHKQFSSIQECVDFIEQKKESTCLDYCSIEKRKKHIDWLNGDWYTLRIVSGG